VFIDLGSFFSHYDDAELCCAKHYNIPFYKEKMAFKIIYKPLCVFFLQSIKPKFTGEEAK